jgi:uncharacterized Zn-finger protein
MSFICKKCNKIFKLKTNLTTHLNKKFDYSVKKISMSEKPFCQKCNYNHKLSLYRHKYKINTNILIHGNEDLTHINMCI